MNDTSASGFSRALAEGGVGETLIIAAQFRSGSTLLGKLLKLQTGLPFDVEPFNTAPTWQMQDAKQVTDTWGRFLARSRDGRHGFRLMWSHMNALANYFVLDASRGESVIDLFPDPRLVFLRRHDKVAQAVSYYLASRSGDWQRPPETVQNQVPIEYSFEAIHRIFSLMLGEDWLWLELARMLPEPPLVLEYSASKEDWNAMVRKALKAFGLNYRAELWPDRMPLERHEHFQSEEFQTLFRRDLRSYVPLEFLPTRLAGKPTPRS